RPRLRVDQLDAGAGQPLQRGVDVIDRVGDVMQARALALQVLADRGVGAERRQQLDVPVADVEQHRLDALRLDRLAVRQLHLEALLVKLDAGLEVLDGDTHVIYTAEHARQSTRRSPRAGSRPGPRRRPGAA